MTPAQMKVFLDAGIPQAFAAGRTIQKSINGYEWGWVDLKDLTLTDDPSRYRIKPEPPTPKARPFNADEMESLVGCKLRSKSGDIHLVTDCTTVWRSTYHSACVRINGTWYDAKDLRENYTMMDGGACGVIE